jgi:predicted metal-binding membrane protein
VTKVRRMTPAARERSQVRVPLLFISAATWVLLVVEPGSMPMFAHCPATSSGAMPLSASFQMLLAMNSPASLAAGWVLMLVAMMSPVLIPPVRHIRLRSFMHRRARASVLFAASYAAIWMAAGVMLLALGMGARLVAPASSVPVAVVAIVALLWQFSPVKQRCLNRCHSHPGLAAFGLAADLDAVRFGLAHGVWCVGSCWALMLLPLVVSRGHVAVMAAVALWLAAERLERPMPPRWAWRGPSKAARILVAQARMRLGPCIYATSRP